MQLVELLVPAIIIALIGAIKNSITVDTFGDVIPTLDTPVATWDVLVNRTVYPNVLCYDNNAFLRYNTPEYVHIVQFVATFEVHNASDGVHPAPNTM